jgi:hypothetical protein
MTSQKHATLDLLRSAIPHLVHRISVDASGIPNFEGLTKEEWHEALYAILDRRPELRARLAAGLEGCTHCDD